MSHRNHVPFLGPSGLQKNLDFSFLPEEDDQVTCRSLHIST